MKIYLLTLALMLTAVILINLMDTRKLVGQLKLHEGYKAYRYLDTTGHPTVGIGFNLSRGDAEIMLRSVGADYHAVLNGDYTLSVDQAETLVKKDIERVEDDARRLLFIYDDLNDVRQRVVCDMIFNLGPYGFKQFKKMITHLSNGDYAKAAEEMKDSMWARQTKGRARVLAIMMKTGEDVYDL